jgi:hypothetical protein
MILRVLLAESMPTIFKSKSLTSKAILGCK